MDGINSAPAVRTAPHNIEAERGFLGGVFVESGSTILESVTAFLRPEHFSFEAHGHIFAAALKLHERGAIVDPTTIKRFFEADDSVAEIGGPAYLANLVTCAVTPINAQEYGRIVHELWQRREIIAAAEALTDGLYGADMATADALETHEAALAALAIEDTDKGGLVPFGDIVAPTLAEIDRAAQAGSAVGLTTGIGDLDKFLGGFMPSDLIVIAARPGMGKTALGLTIAKANASEGKRVGFFSLEMPAEQLMMRALAMETGVSASDMRRGEPSGVQVDAIRRAGDTFTDLPLLIDDRGAVSTPYIRSRAKGMKRKGGLDLLVIDYLGLVRAEDRYRGYKVHEISETTAALKALAKELGIPVVLLSQLNRSVEQRDDRHPRLSDLRDSGSIEQDADAVLLLYRESYYLEMDGPPKAKTGESDDKYAGRMADWQKLCDDVEGVAEIIIAKNRQGRTGKVAAHFNGARTMFGDLAK